MTIKKRFSGQLCTIICASACMLSAAASAWALNFDPNEKLPSGTHLISGAYDQGNTFRSDPDVGAIITPVEGPTFAPANSAFRVHTPRVAQNPWGVEYAKHIESKVVPGDTCFVRVYMRTIDSVDESEEGEVAVYFQRNTPGWDKSFHRLVRVPGEWTQFNFPFANGYEFAAGEASVYLAFGTEAQTVEIAGLTCINYKNTQSVAELPETEITYEGSEPDALWRKQALARIENVRKGDMNIEIVDASGKPLPNCDVQIEMTRHAFRFGTAVVPWRMVSDEEENKIYTQKIFENFNAAVTENALKWQPWIGEWGELWSKENTLRGLSMLKEKGFYTRGHVLVWPSWRNLPKSLKALHEQAPDQVLPAVEKHIDDLLESTAFLIDEWDALNEPFDNHDLMDLYGREIMPKWFNQASARMPDTPMFINDYGILSGGGNNVAHQDHYEETIAYILESGGQLDGIGFQGHIGGGLTAPKKLLEIIDRYSKFGVPIAITEFDVDLDDVDVQAKYWRDFMITVFSHENVNAFLMWGFWEKAHWRPKAAMFDENWNPKPTYHTYRDLVYNQWWTRLEETTNKQGACRARGFYGDYKITFKHDGRTYEETFKLTPELSNFRFVWPAESASVY